MRWNCRLWLLVAFAMPAGAAPPAAAPERVETRQGFEALLRDGDAAFAGRGDPLRLEAAIAAYARAAALRPGDAAASLKLARADAFLAMSDPSKARGAWSESARAAERVLRGMFPRWAAEIDAGRSAAEAVSRIEAPGAEALYWFALGTMGGAQARGFAAVLAVKDVARASMERALALDESVDSAGPRRALGAWTAALPSAAGGGAAAAKAHFDRAHALFPQYQLTLVREAETYGVLVQDAKLFDALLGAVVAFNEAGAPAVAPENQLAKRLARALLARKDRLF